jgi:hypothetical protein
MRTTRFAGWIAAGWLLVAGAGAASAQDSAQAAAAAPDSACELHFWPTEEAMTGNNPFINSALQPGTTTRDVLLEALPPQAQVAGLERLDLAGLLAMPGVRVILESQPIRTSVATRQRTRLTASTASCYAELFVKRMGYRTDPFFGRDFGAVFIYRRFAPGGAAAQIVQGDGEVGLRIFPARQESQREAAREEMVAAFGTSFEKFARDKLNRAR